MEWSKDELITSVDTFKQKEVLVDFNVCQHGYSKPGMRKTYLIASSCVNISWKEYVTRQDGSTGTNHNVAQSCNSVIGDKPFLWNKAKFDPP